MRKPALCICENKSADQLRGNCAGHLISAFVFATYLVQSLYFLKLDFEDSAHLLSLHNPVCVGPGWKPQRWDFSRCGSFLWDLPPKFFMASVTDGDRFPFFSCMFNGFYSSKISIKCFFTLVLVIDSTFLTHIMPGILFMGHRQTE